MQAKYANTNLLLPSEQLLGNSAEASQAQGPIVEQFVNAPLPRDGNLALVDDWDCLRVSSLVPPGLPLLCNSTLLCIRAVDIPARCCLLLVEAHLNEDQASMRHLLLPKSRCRVCSGDACT